MTKQIGVIADIHSNHTAFRTAVEYMEQRGVTEYFLLGDFVTDTTDTAETMQYIRELMDRYEVRLLRGNREDYIIQQRKALRGEMDAPEWLYNSASGNLKYAYDLLTDEDIDFFESLPITFTYECEGYPSIVCCHGSPESDRELMYVGGKNTRDWLQKIDADYLIAAHTHYQGEWQCEGKKYFNTGACGIAIATPGKAQCLILHGRDGSEPEGAGWDAEFLQLPYDVDYVVNALYDKGLMEKGKWFISNNIFTLRTGADYTPELVNTAMELQEKDTGKPVVWPYIEEEYFAQSAKIHGIPEYREKDSSRI